jgi:SNF2 family DNA or RNA helicase
MIRLDARKERVTLSAPWDPSLAARCRSLPGWSWAKTYKEWSWPLSMASLRALRREFGDELVVSPELMAWAAAERATERHLKRLSAKTDTELLRVPEIAPTLAEAMASRTYQRVGAAFGARAGNFLLADEPGLGKSAEAIAAIIEMDSWKGDHLISASKASLDSVWRRQLSRWTPDAEVVVMPEGRAKREAAWEEFLLRDQPRFLVLNLSMLRRKYGRHCKKCDVWEGDKRIPKKHYMESHTWTRAVRDEDWPDILNNTWESVILDESHRALAAYVPSNVTQQTAGLLDLNTKHRIALTGTPLRGHERRIWGTLDWLGARTGGFWAWADTYFETTNNGFGIEIGELAPGMSHEFHKSIDRMVLRRTRSEVRADLPMGQRLDVLVEMTDKHRKQYTEFEEDGETKLESGMLSGQGMLSELTRLRQLAFGTWTAPAGKGVLVPTQDSPKLEWIMEFLTARGVAGPVKERWMPEDGSAYKYVIASQFTQIVDGLEALLNSQGIDTLKITGAVTGDKRNKAVDTFQSTDKRYRVMLLNTMTGGESIELDAWCDEMVILDETYVADDQVQLEGRINNRSGRVAPRTWWYVRTADTIEQTIAEQNYMQHDLQHKLLDGRRGVELALHLIRKEHHGLTV